MIINLKKLLTLSFFFVALTVFAKETSDEHAGEEKFNPAEMILHHISDSHGFHLWGEGHESVSVPLPVIVYTPNNGLDVFSSAAFHHGEEAVNKGENTYVLHHNKIYLANVDGSLDFDEEGHALNEKPLDFSITKNVFSLLLSAVLLLLIFISVARFYSRKGNVAPKGLAAFMEPIILFVRDDIAIPNIGEKKYAKFLPYLLSVFFFIWINNLLGLIPIFPGSANLSGNIALTMVLAFITMVITNLSANKDYWKHIFNTPGVPWWLKLPIPLMPLVEFIGVLSKPFALMIRLFANITAGHIIILSLISLIFIFESVAWAGLSVPFALFMNVLELLVAALQAYIFTLLSALFIGMAVEEHDHEHAH